MHVTSTDVQRCTDINTPFQKPHIHKVILKPLPFSHKPEMKILFYTHTHILDNAERSIVFFAKG